LAFRQKLAALLDAIEPTGIFLNGSADKTGRLMAGSIVSIMEIYNSDPDFEVLFHKSMQGFLLTVENNS
jgi:hypothetical protein